jgi:hypothetical protein
MKLRIRGNTVRVRLTKSEVAAFAAHGFIEEITDFGHGQILVCALTAAEIGKPTATFINGTIEIKIPVDDVRRWTDSDEVSIGGTTDTLVLLVEKDFKCLTPRDGDDDADTFPHPRSADDC